MSVNAYKNSILQEFISGITALQPNFLTSLYITGSIPLNDYQPRKSDIDFVILCNEIPSGDFKLRLGELHHSISRKYKKPELNGVYVTPSALNFQNAESMQTLSYHEGKLRESRFDMAAITLFELKTTAITFYGIPVEDLSINVDLKDVHAFLFHNINSYWKNWVEKHSFPRPHYMVLVMIPRLTEWTLLGIARQLYTLKTGRITSKSEAGHYCISHLPGKFHTILQQAMKIRSGTASHLLNLKPSYYVGVSFTRAHNTVACAKFMIQLFNETYMQEGMQEINPAP